MDSGIAPPGDDQGGRPEPTERYIAGMVIGAVLFLAALRRGFRNVNIG